MVEVSSDEDERGMQPRLSGVLRGLNPDAVILPTQPSIEVADEDDGDGAKSTRAVRHGTRQSLYGKSEANYDMKVSRDVLWVVCNAEYRQFHPMDVVTRPKRAAMRGFTMALPGDNAETDEESLHSSALVGDESGDEESSDEEDVPAPRVPDPNATRHPGRVAALNTVNYSRKHHPQDHSLPGYQHKARKLKNLKKRFDQTASPAPKPGRRPHSPIVLINGDTDDGTASDEDVEVEMDVNQGTKRLRPQNSSPRKKLRMLEDDREQTSRTKAKLKRGATETGSDIVHLLDFVVENSTPNDPTATNDRKTLANNPKHHKKTTAATVTEPQISTAATRTRSLTEEAVDEREPRKFLDETNWESMKGREEDGELPFFNDTRIHRDGIDDSDTFMFMDHAVSYDDSGHGGMGQGNTVSGEQEEIQGHYDGSTAANTAVQKQSSPSLQSQRPVRHGTDQEVSSGSDAMDLDYGDSRQSLDHALPSQFDEQLAVTDIQAHKPIVSCSNHTTTQGGYTAKFLSGVETYLKDAGLHRVDRIASPQDYVEISSMVSTDGPELSSDRIYPLPRDVDSSSLPPTDGPELTAEDNVETGHVCRPDMTVH